MTRFIVRMELLNKPTKENYEALYEAMAAEHFTDEIKGTDGTYKMQPGEYQWQGTATTEQIMTKARAAGTKSGASFSVFVTMAAEAASIMWINLPKV